MKSARFLVTIIGLGALTLATGFAGEPPNQTSKNNSQENPANLVRPAGRPPGNEVQADQTQAKVKDKARSPEKISEPVPLNSRIKRPPANELHPPVLKKAATTANGGLAILKRTNRPAAPAKLPVGSGATAPTTVHVRGRSDAVAVLGGATASSANNSAAGVNGADLKHKL